jgi:fructose-bisphosphate aldolase class II
VVGGYEDQVQADSSEMTDPEMALQFVQKTGIDSLAIAIGNNHGIPTKGERLDFDRLAAISSKVSIPLVLHGASGTPPLDIQKAIKLGVAKINIDTDLRLAFNDSLRGFLRKNPSVYDPRAMMGATIETIKKVVESKIELFGSKDKS